MTLQPGNRLGPYEILGPLGAGGMGEVYKARDTRLDRIVAVKVIGASVTETPELRERFEREARAISQLNHPGICTLHDVGLEGDVSYLVLEYIDGESLAARIQRGPMAPDEALPIAIAVCEALDSAHRMGIVHRDLKPGNIMLVKSARQGSQVRSLQAKLLDFGLAKLAPAAGPAAAGSVTAPATITTPLTARGSIIGTFHYMAPEQLEGAESDARTDIWAFGCVLYEMLTGRRPFEGKSQATLISAIVASEPPPMSAVQPLAPPALDYTVRTCLAKSPDDRFQNAHDLLLQLRWVASAGSQAGVPAAVVDTRRRRSGLRLAAVVAASVLVTAAATWWLVHAPASPPPVLRADLVLPPGISYNPGISVNLALSPDGTRLVFSGVTAEDSRLQMRELHGVVTPIAGTENGLMPFFSPDGQWIGFGGGGRLRKVHVSGGNPTVLANVPAIFGALWTPDDSIIFAGGSGVGLLRVPASGGEPAAVTTLEPGETDHRWPSLLPDGRTLLYAAGTGRGWSEARLVLQPLDGGARTVLAEGGTAPRYMPSGHLVFARDRALLALPFDAGRRAATGPSRSVVDEVTFNDADGRAHYTVSPAGMLLYVEGTRTTARRALVWVGRDGRVERLPVAQRGFEHPRLSADGRHLAITVRDGDPDIWTVDLSRMTLSRFTFDVGEEESPVWTPDSQHLTFSASRPGKPRQTLWKKIDGSGTEEELFTTPRHQHLGSWTPDGQTLVTEEVENKFALFAATRGRPEWTSLLSSRFPAQGVQVSPDGRWIVYSSNEGGTTEIYVQAFPGPGGKSQVSAGGGTEPRWSPAGNELFYRAGDRLMAVTVRTQPTFSADTPRVLFEGRFSQMPWGQANYDVSRDGKRFLMIQGDDAPLPGSFKLIANWFQELRSLVPPRQ